MLTWLLSMVDLSKQAIQAALACDWQRAIELNLKIVKDIPENIQALNRLAYAYLQNEDIKKAERLYNSILKLDPTNLVANKYKQRLKNSTATKKGSAINGQIYIEEPGTTKSVSLVHTAPKDVLEKISPGLKVQHKIGKKKVEIRIQGDEYIGSLPDDISFHMRKLSEKGNKYDIYIKEVSGQKVMVFIKEMFCNFDTKKKTFNSLNSLAR